jgi:glutaconyl-CoA/methylmalonyl-CoA decarboxylase subunit gamma
MKMFRVVVNGSEYEVGVEELSTGNTLRVEETRTIPAPKTGNPTPAPRQEPPKPPIPGGSGENILAPMPGTILRIEVSPGNAVKRGDTLLILEAMKMENEILAPHDCVVKQVNVAQGASVNAGDLLVVLTS